MNSHSFIRRAVFLSIALLLVVVLVSTVSACPNCKDAIAANDSDQMRVARGYFWSILFMMSMPFALLGTFSTYVYLEVRRARADREQLERRGEGATADSMEA